MRLVLSVKEAGESIFEVHSVTTSCQGIACGSNRVLDAANCLMLHHANGQVSREHRTASNFLGSLDKCPCWRSCSTFRSTFFTFRMSRQTGDSVVAERDRSDGGRGGAAASKARAWPQGQSLDRRLCGRMRRRPQAVAYEDSATGGGLASSGGLCEIHGERSALCWGGTAPSVAPKGHCPPCRTRSIELGRSSVYREGSHAGLWR